MTTRPFGPTDSTLVALTTAACHAAGHGVNSGQAKAAILVTLYIFSEGSRGGEDGELIYYRYL